ncbi:MAG: type IX secretion system outer membrane channel protein PorV [Bacteroidales bacterium]|nr:type IX secretion system outer membrane channel protein PorV [Bacteroidales bacterium]
MKKAFLPLLLMSLVLITNVQGQTIIGQDKYLNTITTAVPFLQIAPDSRAGALADMGAATSVDVNSQAYNPAKYVFSPNIFGISVSYSPWLHNLHLDDGINLAYLSGYYRPTEMDAIGFSLRYFNLGSILFTEDGIVGVDYNPNEFAIDFTYNRKLIDELSIAMTPRFVYSNLTLGQFVDGQETKPGLAGAADISLFYQQDFKARGMENSTLRAGLNIQNLGSKMRYSSGTNRREFLPANLKLGVGYEMDFDGFNKLAITGEMNKLLVPSNPLYAEDSMGRPVYDEYGNRVIAAGRNPDVSVPQGLIQSFYDAPGIGYGRNGNPSVFGEELAEVIWSIGAEYSYRDLFFFRVGYFHENKNKGNRQFLSLGAGIKYNIFNIDVSYLVSTNGMTSPLANTLRFTLSFDFASFNKAEIKNQGKLR